MVTHASGRHPMASLEKIESWTRTHGQYNIALRLPDNVLALDVDVYKGDLDRLEILQEQLGTLPKTWNSDSRGGQGGKLLYRVPSGMKWQSSIGGITIVQHTHRYVMAFPSFNKESNSKYIWHYGLDGKIVPDYTIPSIDDLTELPEKWIKALEKHETQRYYNLEPQDIELDMFNDGEPCPFALKLMQTCKEKLTQSYDSGLHDTGLSVIGSLMKAASDGHTGIPTAVLEMGDIFRSAPRNRDLATEWFNIVDWQLAQIEADNISEFDTCRLKIELEIQDDFIIYRNAGMSFKLATYCVARRRMS